MDRDSDVTRDEITVDYYNNLPGPCGECCLKFPCPSIIAFICMILGDLMLLVGFHLGANDAKIHFIGTPVTEAFNVWFTNVQVVVYCASFAMLILAVVMLAMGCLGTGATRSVFICRFKTRSSGRCQTSVFVVIAYFLFLCWLTATCFAVVPVFFMFVMNHSVCYGVEMDQQTCLNLVQWGLLPPDTAVGMGKELVCGDKMENICNSYMLFFFSIAFLGCLLMLLASVQFTINLSSNFAQLLDRYKRAYLSGRAGSYKFRSGTRDVLRGSSKPRPTASAAGRGPPGPETMTGMALARMGAGNGAYAEGNSIYGAAAEPDQREYATLEQPPVPPPYITAPVREPVSNLQQHQRTRSFDPLDYNEYASGLNTSRVKNLSRSAEPIDFGTRFDHYDRYNEYDI